MEFYKYQGTGNDFVMIDNRDHLFPKDRKTIAKICQRRFGIGGDGLILLENDAESDFKMVYYNADGGESTMCGNGGRCITAFANFLGIFKEQCMFSAADGMHDAQIKENLVRIKMIDVEQILNEYEDYILNTGSPHYVKRVDDIANFAVFQEGNGIRNSVRFKEEGINVNFVEIFPENEIFVRTYERGVEDETFSCGTGVTAAALTVLQENGQQSLKVKTLGGDLKVFAEKYENGFRNIWLEGPAQQVFQGKIDLKSF